jgi:hypothetical protein
MLLVNPFARAVLSPPSSKRDGKRKTIRAATSEASASSDETRSSAYPVR